MDAERVKIVDVRGYLPEDPRIEAAGGYDTVRYGEVAVGYLNVAGLTELPTGSRYVRQWRADDGTTYVYEMGVTPGDPYIFYIVRPEECNS